MHCDFCGKRSEPELDKLTEGYDGVYYCGEECRDKARSQYDRG
jgi:hypothetical protein